MSAILSKPAPEFDISTDGFRRAAGDVGEVIALLAGGVQLDPERMRRLAVSMRTLQGFLLEEATQQEWREAISSGVIAGQPLAFPGCQKVAVPALIEEVS